MRSVRGFGAVRSVHAVIAAASGFLLAAPPGAGAQEGFPGDRTRDEWRNSLVVYLWAVNQDVDLTVGPVQVPLEASFGDLWDIMRFAASAHYEGQKGDWGLLLDGSYAHLGEDGVTVIADPAGEADLLTANYSWKVFRGDALAIWSPLEFGSQRLDFLGGIRITSQKTSLNLTGPISLPPELARRGFDEVWVDPIVGVRYGIGWGRYDRWLAWARGDVGGFGVGSDLALNGEIGFAYRISRLVFIAVGGRWLHSDYESGSKGTEGYFAYEGDETGLYLGIGFRF